MLGREGGRGQDHRGRVMHRGQGRQGRGVAGNRGLPSLPCTGWPSLPLCLGGQLAHTDIGELYFIQPKQINGSIYIKTCWRMHALSHILHCVSSVSWFWFSGSGFWDSNADTEWYFISCWEWGGRGNYEMSDEKISTQLWKTASEMPLALQISQWLYLAVYIESTVLVLIDVDWHQRGKQEYLIGAWQDRTNFNFLVIEKRGVNGSGEKVQVKEWATAGTCCWPVWPFDCCSF